MSVPLVSMFCESDEKRLFPHDLTHDLLDIATEHIAIQSGQTRATT